MANKEKENSVENKVFLHLYFLYQWDVILLKMKLCHVQEELATDINNQNWKSSTGAGSPPIILEKNKGYFNW